MFSYYIGEYAYFVPFFRHLGGMAALGPLDPPFKVMAPRPRLIRIYVYLQSTYTIYDIPVPTQITTEDDICTEYLKKWMQILACIGKVYHRFKQNVSELESRQFGPDSDSWAVATTPGDSDSDSDSAPLHCTHMYLPTFCFFYTRCRIDV